MEEKPHKYHTNLYVEQTTTDVTHNHKRFPVTSLPHLGIYTHEHIVTYTQSYTHTHKHAHTHTHTRTHIHTGAWTHQFVSTRTLG